MLPNVASGRRRAASAAIRIAYPLTTPGPRHQELTCAARADRITFGSTGTDPGWISYPFLSVDDGLSVTFGGALTCDPARWGHLEVFAAAVLSVDSLAALGARFGTAWETSHRSGWRIELTTDLARHELRIGRGLRVF